VEKKSALRRREETKTKGEKNSGSPIYVSAPGNLDSLDQHRENGSESQGGKERTHLKSKKGWKKRKEEVGSLRRTNLSLEARIEKEPRPTGKGYPVSRKESGAASCGYPGEWTKGMHRD